MNNFFCIVLQVLLNTHLRSFFSWKCLCQTNIIFFLLDFTALQKYSLSCEFWNVYDDKILPVIIISTVCISNNIELQTSITEKIKKLTGWIIEIFLIHFYGCLVWFLMLIDFLVILFFLHDGLNSFPFDQNYWCLCADFNQEFSGFLYLK